MGSVILDRMGYSMRFVARSFLLFGLPLALSLGACVAANKREVKDAGKTSPSADTNRAPEISSQFLYFDGDGERLVTLNATDADGDPVTYEIITHPDPDKGSLNTDNIGNGTVVFSSVQGVTGNIVFSVKATDGELESEPANITVHIPKITGLATGGGTSCAIVDMRAKCWGLGTKGQLGHGAAQSSLSPVMVLSMSSGVTKISLGAEHGCGLLESGVMRCWGSNSKGAVGKGSLSDIEHTPVTIEVTDVTAIGTGKDFSCALTSAGAVYCWGDNSKNQIGEGLGSEVVSPQVVADLDSGVSSLAVGGSHVCVVKNGKTYCWGANEFGQVGIADIAVSSVGTPTLVDDEALPENSVSSLTAGRSHTCAVLTDLKVKCWGRNNDGELGL